jgi:hypothetical protein
MDHDRISVTNTSATTSVDPESPAYWLGRARVLLESLANPDKWPDPERDRADARKVLADEKALDAAAKRRIAAFLDTRKVSGVEL